MRQLELPVHTEGRLYEAITWTVQRRQCSDATRIQHHDHRRWLVEYFGDISVRDIGFAEVMKYIDHERGRQIMNVTIRKRLVTLRMALDDAYRRGLIETKTDWWPRLEGDSKPGKDLWTHEQWRRGRLAFDPGQRIGIDVGWWTGMHLSDVLRWKRGDVDFAEGGWRRYNTKSKADPRWLPMPEEFHQLLEEWFVNEGMSFAGHKVAPLFWHYPTKSIARACAAAGLPRITMLGLRRSCATYQFTLGEQNGIPPERLGEWVALWLGHKGDPRTSDIIRRHYGRWTDERIKIARPF